MSFLIYELVIDFLLFDLLSQNKMHLYQVAWELFICKTIRSLNFVDAKLMKNANANINASKACSDLQKNLLGKLTLWMLIKVISINLEYSVYYYSS